MKKPNKKLMTLLLLSAVIGTSVCGCSEAENDSGVLLEKTVFLGLLEEVESLDISEETKRRINDIAVIALSENASLADILQATADLNSIKSKFLNEPLVFIDSALKAKVCKALGRSENAVITVQDVLNVRELDLSHSAEDEAAGKTPIHYIADLRKFPMLKKLDLDGNEIFSLDGAENLVSLTEISLSGCFCGDSAMDITPLTKAKNIEILDLSNNNIESIAPLSTLDNLTSLDISNIKATDIFVIAGFSKLTELGIGGLNVNGEILTAMKGLKTLDISHTKFNSTPNISALTQIEKLIADGADQKITDQISSLAKLKSLTVSECGMTSAEFLKYLPELEYLNLSDNEITDISTVYGLEKLTRLNVSNNKLTSVSTNKLTNLLTLNVSNNELVQLHLLGDHSSLVKINASNNALVSVKAEKMSGLTELEISNNPITDGSFFAEFSEIKKITADNTKFTELNLSHCQKLINLSLRNVPLESTEGLSNLKALQTLDLYGSSISDISAFENMPGLKTLTATFKNVADYSPLSGLTAIEKITIFRMNNADWDSFNTMKTLRSVYIENSVMKEPKISGLPELTELSIIDCPYMTSSSGLSNLPKLKTLKIDGSDIPSPTIRSFPELETLILTGCDIEYPEKIADLPKLKYLDLSRNDLEALVFSELPALEYLNVSECRVVTIKDLNAEMSYGTLILSNNYISDISVLDDIYKSLKKLDISQNKIKKYDALQNIEIEEVLANGNKAEYIPANE